MVWARLDDQFHTHEKVAELDPTPATIPLMAGALGLHLLALSWCSDKLTDGVVPRSQPARLIGAPVDNLIEELMRVGLWERHKRGYLIHDFLDYNPSKAQVEALRAVKSEAGRRGGIASGKARSEAAAQAYAEAHAKALAQAAAEADAKQVLKQNGSRCSSKNEPPGPVSRIPPSEYTDPGGVLETSSAEKTPTEDEPVDNPTGGEVDDFAGIDFGEEEPEAESPQNTTPPVQERGTSPAPKKTPAAKKPAGPPIESLIRMYNELCPSLPRVQKAEGARRDRLLRAHAQMGEKGLRAYFARVEASDFLAGRKKDWRADLDFILKPENMGRILEGVHDNRIRGRTNVASALAIQERCEREAVSGVSG